MKRVILLSLFACGCALLKPQEDKINTSYLEQKVSDPQFVKETEELKAAAGALNNEEYDSSKKLYETFLKVHPQSLNLSEATYGVGLSYEGLGDWQKAISYYENLAQFKLKGTQDYPARALFRMSFCFESLGLNEKAILALKDAENMSVYLPAEISLAELPARMAGLYARLGQETLADEYMGRAEAGIKRLKILKKSSDGPWLGASLYQMGVVSMTQLSRDTFQQIINTLLKSQKYLLQAISLEQEKWSLRAQEELVSNYKNLLQFIKSQKIIESDYQANQVITGQWQAEASGHILESLEGLRTLASPPSDRKNSENELFKSLEPIELEAKEILLTKLYLAPMTPEAQKLIEMKRNLKLQDLLLNKPSDSLDQPPPGIPVKLPEKKAEDPNI